MIIGRPALLAAIIAGLATGESAVALGPCPRCHATLGDNAERCDTCLRATGREPSLFGYSDGVAIGDGSSSTYALTERVKALGAASTHAATAATNLAEEVQRTFTNADLERMAAAAAKRERKALKLPKD